ncbi:unnamed protein product [Lymnaea stagnalis]|uniref:Uncharacterized protein n=1 Tax=Lymnaea stagnalis TaxID=6523 RepID=A0AAV2IKD1_LYMST
MQAASKGVVGSLSSQSKHVNIQEVTRASPRVVRKKKKKRRVKKTRTEEVKEVEPVRCPLFQGWDYGTTLEKHTMDHVPMDSDITQLLLTRTTKMLWLKAGSSFKRDLLVPLQYPSAIHAEKTDVKAYLAQHGIREHFQRITNSVLEDPKSEDPLQMMINQGNVLSRQAVYQREAESLLDKMMNKQYANPISFPSFLKTEALRQAEVAESAPTVEESVDEETEEQSDEQATSTMDESATLTGKTSGSTNATNETGGK